MTNIKIKREISENIFEPILASLFQYFQEIKEHRTIRDVDNAFNEIKDKIDLNDLKSLNDDDIEEQIEEVKTYADDLYIKNRENIELTFKNPKAKNFITYWISNLDLTLNILHDSIKILKKQKKRQIFIQRQSKRAREYFLFKLENIVKAVFLVVFRIVEQIYMIIENKNFDVEQEIDYLIEDVVYLKNIQRISELTKV